ncbi:hypothetical protein [Glutamicibacter arilaitensis]|uniref:hypothetical protein n=1 Tax=Glutamicibacter arilaitensis TaxID=256701 RepID=UPI003FD0B5FF
MQVELDWDEDKPGLFAGTNAETVQLLCETCNEPITKDSPGNVLFPKQGKRPLKTEIRFVHKGRCDPGNIPWNEIDIFLKRVIASL